MKEATKTLITNSSDDSSAGAPSTINLAFTGYFTVNLKETDTL